METFYIKSHLYLDRDGLDMVLRGVSRVMIVTDSFMVESGKIAYLTDPLGEKGIEHHIFSEVKPDPDIHTVARGMDIYLEFEPQLLIAFGGGSPIDAAKAMKYLAEKQGSEISCRLVAVPTTSGTGSEVSKFSVVSDPEKAVKHPLVAEEMIPDAALLDASLITSVPPSVTADTGIDVLTHAIEAFVSIRANDFTDAAAEKAVKLVRSNLLLAYREPDNLKARQKMHYASCLAGMAFSNAGLGLNHGMAHTLGAHFHIPHGRANGVLLPYVMAHNAGCHDTLTPVAARYARLARIMRIEGPSIRQSAFSMIRTTRQLVKNLHIPDKIEDLGIFRADFEAALPEMVEAALADATTATNPRACSAEDIHTVFMRAYTGKLL